MYKNTEKEEWLNRLQQTDLLKKLPIKKEKELKRNEVKYCLFFIIYVILTTCWVIKEEKELMRNE